MKRCRESDFAAWVLIHGYMMNHLAFSVHRLKHQFSDIKCIKEYLEERDSNSTTTEEFSKVCSPRDHEFFWLCIRMALLFICFIIGLDVNEYVFQWVKMVYYYKCQPSRRRLRLNLQMGSLKQSRLHTLSSLNVWFFRSSKICLITRYYNFHYQDFGYSLNIIHHICVSWSIVFTI